MKGLHYIFSHSIFVALGAAALGFETCLILKIKPDVVLSASMFTATLVSYNTYWLVTNYFLHCNNTSYRRFVKSQALKLSLLLLGVVLLVVFVFYYKQIAAVAIIAAILNSLYMLPAIIKTRSTILAKAGFLKTVLLAFTWAFVTVLFPAAFAKMEISNKVLLFLYYRFIYMLLLSIIFDLRDVAVDKIKGLGSLATVVNSRVLLILFLVLYAVFMVLPFMQMFPAVSVRQVIAYIISVTTVLLLFIKALVKQRGYLFYYFLADGCMLLSPALVYLASI